MHAEKVASQDAPIQLGLGMHVIMCQHCRTKSSKQDVCVALYNVCDTRLYSAQVGHIVLLSTPHVYPHMEWPIHVLPLLPSSIEWQIVTALWPVLISVPTRVGGWVGLSGSAKYWDGFSARRGLQIPVLAATAGNRTHDRRVASPTP